MNNPTQEILKKLLHYGPETGVFTWRVTITGCVDPGDVAGYVDGDGYRYIKMSGKKCKAHRLAWLYMYGHFPPDQTDHINQDPSDNRLVNLRSVSFEKNMQNKKLPANNTSGLMGVGFCKRENKWLARITVSKKHIDLGYYPPDFEGKMMALAARKNAEEKYGFHPNHGSERQ